MSCFSLKKIFVQFLFLLGATCLQARHSTAVNAHTFEKLMHAAVRHVKVTGPKIRPALKRTFEDPENKQLLEIVSRWVQENPKQAFAMGIGGYCGYKSSGDGLLSATLGGACGLVTGFSILSHYRNFIEAKNIVLSGGALEAVLRQASLAKEGMWLSGKGLTNFSLFDFDGSTYTMLAALVGLKFAQPSKHEKQLRAEKNSSPTFSERLKKSPTFSQYQATLSEKK